MKEKLPWQKPQQLRRKKRPAPKSRPIPSEAVNEISASLRALLADVFALYVKTKNCHRHTTGRHFRDYHLLLDEPGEQDRAERACKIGGTTLPSIGDIAEHQRLQDSNEEFLSPERMWDDLELTRFLRHTHEICDGHDDVAIASLVETWIDQTERRVPVRGDQRLD